MKPADPAAWPGVLLGAALAAPLGGALAVTPVLGPMDLPLHALIAGLAAAPDPLPPFAARVAVPLGAPYRALYDLVGLAGPAGVLPLLRAVLAATALGTPAAAAWAAAGIPGADPRLAAALAVVPLTGFMLWSGFAPYLAAAPLGLVVLGAVLRLLRGDRPGPAALVGALGLAGAYLLHPFGLAVAAAPVAAAPFARAGPRRRATAALGLAAVGLLLLTAAVLRGREVDPGRTSSGLAGLAGHLARPGDVIGQLGLLARGSWVHLGGGRADVALGLAAVVAAGAALAAGAGALGPRRTAPRGARVALGAALGAPLLLLAGLPLHAFGVAYVGPRFTTPALLAAAVALAALGGRAPPRARDLGLALAVAGALGLSSGAALAVWDVGRELSPVLPLGDALADEPGPRRVLSLVFQPRTQAVARWFVPAANASLWSLLRAGAADPRLTANVCLPVWCGQGAPPIPVLFAPAAYDPDVHGPFTHVVVRLGGGVEGEGETLRRVGRDHDLVLQTGDWRLYRRRPPG